METGREQELGGRTKSHQTDEKGRSERVSRNGCVGTSVRTEFVTEYHPDGPYKSDQIDKGTGQRKKLREHSSDSSVYNREGR